MLFSVIYSADVPGDIEVLNYAPPQCRRPTGTGRKATIPTSTAISKDAGRMDAIASGVRSLAGTNSRSL